ncbi:E3 SUMO-protein ligase KIAA1586-like [Paramisgurnus dabryanus]|uniref:E3 SUMO-protein ligase KIAA1586-like n=1 Tax=Paramisgurnus dabryanus TaxID=90735 RepID=UPI003CCFC17F
MKRKQTQTTLFHCFRKSAHEVIAASGDTATDDTATDDTNVAEESNVTENEPDCTVTLPGCAVCSATKSTGILTEQRVSMSEEWVQIQPSNTNRSTSLASLRNKIRRHETSRAHEIAQELTKKGEQDLFGNLMRTVSDTVLAETDAVFRTAYCLAKMNRPFTDHEYLIELQEKNGVNMGTSLHSRYSSTKIVEHIAKEMQKKIVDSIVSSSSKLSVLIDEATSLSHKSAMIVNIKASFDGATPEFVFLELVELESQRAEDIEQALLNCLDTAGFSKEWLQMNWVSFVSDGASVMLGKNSGVATRLTARYPNLFTWHCLNHRLELAVSNAVDEVHAVNHFKAFMEKIHNLYSQSNKNVRELLEAAQEVGSQVMKIGRVLSTRWVASSFHSVKAVWRSYEALNRHFENAAGDQTRNSKERQTYRGLACRMQSKEFLCDLGLMYDALSELANLSEQLQAHSVTLLRADQLLKCTIRVLTSFKDMPGEKLEEALTAQSLGRFRSVPLESNGKLTPINAKQFLQSLINNMEKRLSFEGEMLHDLSILDKGNWPSTPGVRHGEAQVKRLCRRFNLCEQQAVNGMRDFLEHPDSEPEGIKPLIRCIQTIPCSTAECERGFSLMNIICTDKRSTLLLSNRSPCKTNPVSSGRVCCGPEEAELCSDELRPNSTTAYRYTNLFHTIYIRDIVQKREHVKKSV